MVSSSGGVILDVLHLSPWLERHQVSWAAVPAPDTRVLLESQRVYWCPEATSRQVWRLPGSVLRALRVLRRARPDVVVSSGTGIAVAYFTAARLMSVPTLWLDTFNVVSQPGRAARICRRLASARLVQRSSLAGPGVVYVGELL